MKGKVVSYVLFAIGLVMIIAGGVSSFLIGLRTDQSLMNKRMNVVTDQFEDFSTNTSIFENERDSIYTEVLNNVYFDTMASTDQVVKTRLSNYENMVDEIGKQAVEMKKLCKDVYYPDSSINSKCSNYEAIYEQVVNYFVSDVNVYNANIKKFNEYQKGLGSPIALTEYKTEKKYVDYNKDGNYDGKEEE